MEDNLIRGYQVRRMDRKGRVVIPSEMRSGTDYFLSSIGLDAVFWTSNMHRKQDDEYMQRQIDDKERIAHFSSVEIKADSMGRVVIPEQFRGLLGFFEGDYLFLGNGDCILMRKYESARKEDSQT